MHEVFYVSDIPNLDPAKDLLVDIRTRKEYNNGTIQGAMLLTLE